MKQLKRISIWHLVVLLCAYSAFNQSQTKDSKTWQSVIGEVRNIDPASGKIEIRTDDKKDLVVDIDQKTVFLKIKSNQKSLENAEKISLPQIKTGARVLARGKFTVDKNFTAHTIVVTNFEADETTNTQPTIAGVVTAIDADTKQIEVTISSSEENKSLTLDTKSNQVAFYQYSPNSLKFSNSTSSVFDKIKVGDQFKSVGKFVEGSKVFMPKTIVFGTFRTVGGKVLSIDQTNKNIKLEDIQTKKTVEVSVSDETIVKLLNKEIEEKLISFFFKNTNAPSQTKNLRLFFDTLPTISSDQLTVGDEVIFSVAVSNDSKATAFYVLKDMKTFFSYLEKQRKKGQPLPNLGGISL